MYHAGQLVKVTIDNFKITDTFSISSKSIRGVNDAIQYSTRMDKEPDEIYLSTWLGNVTVEAVPNPHDFSPKVGDVYQMPYGKIWYTRKFDGYGGTIVIEDGAGTSFSDDKMNVYDEMEKFKDMNPKLIVRDGKCVY
jgi:hypothetical protein